ncbi:hypothetical protein A2U01_0098399, partial [Trifolium medium]|nr:hypothetical protein [Trifolium medium]
FYRFNAAHCAGRARQQSQLALSCIFLAILGPVVSQDY